MPHGSNSGIPCLPAAITGKQVHQRATQTHMWTLLLQWFNCRKANVPHAISQSAHTLFVLLVSMFCFRRIVFYDKVTFLLLHKDYSDPVTIGESNISHMNVDANKSCWRDARKWIRRATMVQPRVHSITFHTKRAMK